jgi:hypothetical protein
MFEIELEDDQFEGKSSKKSKKEKVEKITKVEKSYAASVNLFIKGVQIHAGQKIGFCEKMFKQGLIKEL